MRNQLFSIIAVCGLSACQSNAGNPSLMASDATASKGVENMISDAELDTEKTASISDDTNSGTVSSEAKNEISNESRKPKVVIGSYRPPAKGTIFSFKNNWASLDPKLVYKVASTDTKFNEKPAVKLVAIEGTGDGASTFLSLKDANLLGHKDSTGKLLSSFVQVEKRLQFPMKPGDKWVAQWKSKNHKSNKTQSGGGVVYVIGVDTINTAAGKFKTMKIKLPVPPKAGKGIKHHIWYSPKYGMILKEQISDPRFSWVKEVDRIELPS